MEKDEENIVKQRSEDTVRSIIALVIIIGFFAVVFLRHSTNESLTMALGGVIGYYFGTNSERKNDGKSGKLPPQ